MSIVKSSSILDLRPDWDHYFLNLAYGISLRGSCLRRKAGAIFVDSDHHILSTGFNGKEAGLPNCTDLTKVITDSEVITTYKNACPAAYSPSGTNLKECYAKHAEDNAHRFCHALHLLDTCYVTCSSCIHCTKLLLETSCKRIVFYEEYPHTDARDLWLDANREWVYIPAHINSAGVLVFD